MKQITNNYYFPKRCNVCYLLFLLFFLLVIFSCSKTDTLSFRKEHLNRFTPLQLNIDERDDITHRIHEDRNIFFIDNISSWGLSGNHRYFIVDLEGSKQLLVIENHDKSKFNGFDINSDKSFFSEEYSQLVTLYPNDEYSESIRFEAIDIINNRILESVEKEYSISLRNSEHEHSFNFLETEIESYLDPEYGPKVEVNISQAGYLISKIKYWMKDSLIQVDSSFKSGHQDFQISSDLKTINIFDKSYTDLFQQIEKELLSTYGVIVASYSNSEDEICIVLKDDGSESRYAIILANERDSLEQIELKDYYFKDPIKKLLVSNLIESKISLVILTSEFNYDFSYDFLKGEASTFLRSGDIDRVYHK